MQEDVLNQFLLKGMEMNETPSNNKCINFNNIREQVVIFCNINVIVLRKCYTLLHQKM